MADTPKDYEILTDALYVAGRRSPGKGEMLRLSKAEAEYPLLLGHIALKEKQAALPAVNKAES